jgi:hypothetical protein
MIQCIALHNPGVYLWGGYYNTIIEHGFGHAIGYIYKAPISNGIILWHTTCFPWDTLWETFTTNYGKIHHF